MITWVYNYAPDYIQHLRAIMNHLFLPPSPENANQAYGYGECAVEGGESDAKMACKPTFL